MNKWPRRSYLDDVVGPVVIRGVGDLGMCVYCGYPNTTISRSLNSESVAICEIGHRYSCTVVLLENAESPTWPQPYFDGVTSYSKWSEAPKAMGRAVATRNIVFSRSKADLPLDIAEDALRKIRETLGNVCEEFEVCSHPACNDSYAAWAIADEALGRMRTERLRAARYRARGRVRIQEVGMTEQDLAKSGGSLVALGMITMPHERYPYEKVRLQSRAKKIFREMRIRYQWDR